MHSIFYYIYFLRLWVCVWIGTCGGQSSTCWYHLSFTCGHYDQTQDMRLGTERLYLLSHLIGDMNSTWDSGAYRFQDENKLINFFKSLYFIFAFSFSKKWVYYYIYKLLMIWFRKSPNRRNTDMVFRIYSQSVDRKYPAERPKLVLPQPSNIRLLPKSDWPQ